MNPAKYIESIISHLAALEFVVQTNLLREFSNTQKGHLRMRVAFTDGSFLEFYEYIESDEGDIRVVTYAYHWSTASGHLIQRWDNTPHYPKLENFPHHVHIGETVQAGRAMNVFSVLDEIERRLKPSDE